MPQIICLNILQQIEKKHFFLSKVSKCIGPLLKENEILPKSFLNFAEEKNGMVQIIVLRVLQYASSHKSSNSFQSVASKQYKFLTRNF